jgi:hypothetical protein
MVGRIASVVFALWALGCSGSEGDAGDDAVPVGTALGAAEVNLSPPASSVPNIGTRTSCTAGNTGTYTYFLGSTPSMTNDRNRVVGAMVENGNGFDVACEVREETDHILVEVSISGPDANSRRVPASLVLQGAIPTMTGAGALSAGSFYSPDTTELSADPNLADCMLTNGTFTEGGLLADFSCPALVKADDPIAGCAARGTVAFSSCRH